MAQDDDSKGQSITDLLRDNKLNNSELETILKTEGVETTDDLKDHFGTEEDLEQVLKNVRKRTEKILGKFSGKIVEITGLEYEYRAPHRSGKDAQGGGANGNNADPYLSPAESPRGRKKKKKRQGSDMSTGSIGSSPRGQPAKTGKEVMIESNSQSASLMRQWLQTRGIFHKDLFQYLASHGYNAPDDLVGLPEKDFDYIVREVRVETFKAVNEAKKRNRVDKLLVKFEKEWRKYSGIRKTNMTKEQQELWGYSPVSSARSSADEEEDDQGFFN